MASSRTPDDVVELRRQLEAKLEATRERARAGAYAAEIKSLKLKHLEAHNAVEREEELLTNNLMKKLEQVNSEKREMFMRVERRRAITNSLQKRLDRVLREKSELEAHMARNDHEQAKASGELQRRHETLPAERERLIHEKIELERQLEAEQEYIVNKLQKQTAGLAREKDALRADRRAPQAGGATPLGQDPTPSGESAAREHHGGGGGAHRQPPAVPDARTLPAQRDASASTRRKRHPVRRVGERRVGRRGGSFGARRATPHGTPHANPRAGVANIARQHSGGIQLAHAPWERDICASFGRRRSQGSASASSAGGRGREADERRGWNRWGSSTVAAMSIGGSSGATTPSSAANTPAQTPRAVRSAGSPPPPPGADPARVQRRGGGSDGGSRQSQGTDAKGRE